MENNEPKFKVLVFAYYFPPMGLSGVQRTLKFVKYMKQFNWEPTVITTGKTAYFAHDMSLMREAEDAGIRIIRTEGKDVNSLAKSRGTVSMPNEFLRKTLQRISKSIFIPDSKKSWSKKAVKTAQKLLNEESFDALYVTIPPYSAFEEVAKLKQKLDIPLFVDYRDPWYENHFAFYPTPLHKMRHKKLEDQALRQADRVIVVNRRIKESLLKNFQFLKHEEVVIIPHGFDPADYRCEDVVPLNRNKLTITYSGIFYESVTPKYFLKAFKELIKERPDIAANIELHFVGHFRKENRKLVSKLGINEYVFEHGYMDHDDSIKKVIASDVLWVMLGDKKNMDKVTPGKLFEYFGSRKPILACLPDGVARNVASEYGATFVANPHDINSIKNALLEIHNLYKDGKLPKGDEEFIQKHNREKLTEVLTKQFQFFLKD